MGIACDGIVDGEWESKRGSVRVTFLTFAKALKGQCCGNVKHTIKSPLVINGAHCNHI